MVTGPKGFIVAGTHSGVGKTTVTVGLIGAFAERGLRVAPFKAGPDYIDPSYHTAAAGVPSRNLDSWLLDDEVVKASFHRAARAADVAVIEGVMGLFDGRAGDDDRGSAAYLARLLNLPVILVIDARAMARSAGAIAHGFATFDPSVRVVGVIANNVASERHLETIRAAVVGAAGLPLLGGIFKDAALRIPERHLGLIPQSEAGTPGFIRRAREVVSAAVDLDLVLNLAGPLPTLPPGPAGAVPAPRDGGGLGIGVARDAAFSFYYEDSLDLLAEAGAELVPFSPLTDRALPPGIAGVYIGGGFPELFAPELAANKPMLGAIRTATLEGMPVYAECGGHMYLGASLTSLDGSSHRMAGITPVTTSTVGTKLTMGYRTARALRDGPLCAKGEVIRGHEFHLSRRLDGGGDDACWEFVDPALENEGYAAKNVWSSYLHVHLGSVPGGARRIVETFRAVQRMEPIRPGRSG